MGGVKGAKRQDWISLQTLKLADERRNWKGKRRENKEASKHYNYLCWQVKKSAKVDKEEYINETCKAIERSRKQNKSREVYEGVRKITGKFSTKASVIKDNYGKLVTDDSKVKDRWKEYFEELYNDPNLVDASTLRQKTDQSDPEQAPDILLEEVNKAIDRL